MSESKNILYIGGFELPDKNAAAQRVIANGKLLKNLGYNIIFVGVSKDQKANKNVYKNTNTYEDFVYYSISYPRNIMEWIDYLTNISVYNSIINAFNPSIIIAYNYPSIALNKLKKICKKNNIKLVADCTEWYSPKGNLIFRFIKAIDTWLRMKIVHIKLDGIIVISKYLHNYYSKKIKNICYLPPLVDKSMMKWHLDEHILQNTDKINLVYAGSLGRGEKDRLDTIINLIQKINNNKTIILTIVGITQDQFLKFNSNARIDWKEIDKHVVFKGRLNHIDTLNIIKKSHFQIFIRDNTLANTAGFPTKFVESISCGTPVLTNLSSNIEDYLIPGKNGFILDIRSDETLLLSLTHSLSYDSEKYLYMKQFCSQSDVFDYNTHKNEAQLFLDNLK